MVTPFGAIIKYGFPEESTSVIPVLHLIVVFNTVSPASLIPFKFVSKKTSNTNPPKVFGH